MAHDDSSSVLDTLIQAHNAAMGSDVAGLADAKVMEELATRLRDTLSSAHAEALGRAVFPPPRAAPSSMGRDEILETSRVNALRVVIGGQAQQRIAMLTTLLADRCKRPDDESPSDACALLTRLLRRRGAELVLWFKQVARARDAATLQQLHRHAVAADRALQARMLRSDALSFEPDDAFTALYNANSAAPLDLGATGDAGAAATFRVDGKVFLRPGTGVPRNKAFSAARDTLRTAMSGNAAVLDAAVECAADASTAASAAVRAEAGAAAGFEAAAESGARPALALFFSTQQWLGRLVRAATDGRVHLAVYLLSFAYVQFDEVFASTDWLLVKPYVAAAQWLQHSVTYSHALALTLLSYAASRHTRSDARLAQMMRYLGAPPVVADAASLALTLARGLATFVSLVSMGDVLMTLHRAVFPYGERTAAGLGMLQKQLLVGDMLARRLCRDETLCYAFLRLPNTYLPPDEPLPPSIEAAASGGAPLLIRPSDFPVPGGGDGEPRLDAQTGRVTVLLPQPAGAPALRVDAGVLDARSGLLRTTPRFIANYMNAVMLEANRALGADRELDVAYRLGSASSETATRAFLLANQREFARVHAGGYDRFAFVAQLANPHRLAAAFRNVFFAPQPPLQDNRTAMAVAPSASPPPPPVSLLDRFEWQMDVLVGGAFNSAQPRHVPVAPLGRLHLEELARERTLADCMMVSQYAMEETAAGWMALCSAQRTPQLARALLPVFGVNANNAEAAAQALDWLSVQSVGLSSAAMADIGAGVALAGTGFTLQAAAVYSTGGGMVGAMSGGLLAMGASGAMTTVAPIWAAVALAVHFRHMLPRTNTPAEPRLTFDTDDARRAYLLGETSQALLLDTPPKLDNSTLEQALAFEPAAEGQDYFLLAMAKDFARLMVRGAAYVNSGQQRPLDDDDDGADARRAALVAAMLLMSSSGVRKSR